MNHLLSIEELSKDLIWKLIDHAATLKHERNVGTHEHKPLQDQTWAMIFTKASTRTRVSFEVGVRELGGSVMFLSSNDIQLGRGEPIKDTARVMGRMVHGAIIAPSLSRTSWILQNTQESRRSMRSLMTLTLARY